ncbi:hypothetical protein [Haloarcula nitratireducens]|uniref:Uncharacterized protein n=1 Tax=Haloarcula nitratireducens TaxID=2487749 RepID=A0AAW4PJ21_9EURY|nr:hypothetical protein [Halomicroarcula nitratireducens]MBX0297643.1 hypothetical protein [Halomicroarcula nitratireducens]
MAEAAPTARSLQERLGRVYHQPVDVGSWTNKRITVNYRVPLEQLDQLLPWCVTPEEIEDTGDGMLSMCACDFTVTRFGPVPLPPVHTNEMLCRISATVPKDGEQKRAYYTLRSDTSSKVLGLLGGHFSHFRKATSSFDRVDNDETYALECEAEDDLCGGALTASLNSVSDECPDSTVFDNVTEATDFVLELDGSCGYNFTKDKLSFQNIEYPEWDVSFCHDFSLSSSLLDYLAETYDLDMTFDCTLYMADVDQAWNRSWLYDPHEATGELTDGPQPTEPVIEGK